MKERPSTNQKSSEISKDQCLKIIQADLIQRLSNPEESHFCMCPICMNKYQLKEGGKRFLRQTSSLLKLDISKIQRFLGFMCALNESISLKLEIPEIVFFENGQPKIMFKSRNNGIQSKNMAHFGAKNVVNIFVDRKKAVGTASKEIEDLMKSYGSSHIKYFDSIVPSCRHDSNENWGQAKSYVFHNNDKMEGNQFVALSRGSFDEICIVKYHEKGFELLNEKQLRFLLKSNLQTLQGIDFIQNYIKPKQREESFFFSDYDRFQTPTNPYMFERALLHVKVDTKLVSKFSKEYVPIQKLEDYQTILKDIPSEYVTYETYKIIHYIELVRDLKVKKLNTVWIKDENKEVCFFSLLGFDFEENEKVTVDIDLAQIREIKDTQLSDLEKELLKAWESMKKRKTTYEDPPPPDEKEVQEIEAIKNESMIRKKKNSSRKGSICM